MGTSDYGAPTRFRVVYLIWTLRPGGAERQLLELLRGLDRRRYDPSVITFRPGSSDSDCPCPLITLATPTGGLIGKFLLALVCFGRLVRALRKIRPRILHSFLPELATIYGGPAARMAGISMFICSRRSSAKLYRQSVFITIAERYALKSADAMVVNAQCLAEEVTRLDHFPSDDVTVIPNGVDVKKFRPGLPSHVREESGWSSENLVIGIVANFRDCKRHDDFLCAAGILHQLYAETRFILVGSDMGTLEASRHLSRELGLESVTRIITGISTPEEIYGALDIYVCTSETEGLSNVLLEAMACGIPIVATAVGGNPEAVQDGVEGILVPAHTPEAVATAVGRLIQDTGLRSQMGDAGRRRALEHYSMEAMVCAFERVYERTLSRHS